MRNTKRAVHSTAVINIVFILSIMMVLTIILITAAIKRLFAALVALPGDVFVSMGRADELASADSLDIAGLAK